MITMNRVIRILLIAVSFVLIVYVSSWLGIQTPHGGMSNEENFIIELAIGLGWLAAFHFLAFSKAWGNRKYRLYSSVFLWLIINIANWIATIRMEYSWLVCMNGIVIVSAIMYLFITSEYEHFWQIHELSNWENAFILSLCFFGVFLLVSAWWGGILEPYLKRFFENRILKKQKQRTLTDADRDNR